MTAYVDSFSQEYGGAYSIGGFMKCHHTGATGFAAWHQLEDPSGHMPRLPHGGDIQFVRIMTPYHIAAVNGGPGNLPTTGRVIAEYQGTGGAELWAARTGVTGPSGGHAWPRFQLSAIVSGAAVGAVLCFYVEYGRVRSVPR